MNKTFLAWSNKEDQTPPPSFDANGYDYVDMGEVGIWSKFPIGVTSYETCLKQFLIFQWGDIKGRTVEDTAKYNWEEYKFCVDTTGYANTISTINKYCDNSDQGYNGFADNKLILDLEDDMVHANMGGDWRLPTYEEFNNLWDSCTHTWVINYFESGLNGYELILKTDNNKKLFIPAAGWGAPGYDDGGYHYPNSAGGYWYRDLVPNTPSQAWDISFNSKVVFPKDSSRRCFGYGCFGYASIQYNKNTRRILEMPETFEGAFNDISK